MNNIILGYINALETRSKYDLQQCPKKNCQVSPAEKNNQIHKSCFNQGNNGKGRIQYFLQKKDTKNDECRYLY